jgi:hypothetical protein
MLPRYVLLVGVISLAGIPDLETSIQQQVCGGAAAGMFRLALG